MRATLQPGLTFRHTYVVPLSKRCRTCFQAPEIASMPAVLATPYMSPSSRGVHALSQRHVDVVRGLAGVQ